MSLWTRLTSVLSRAAPVQGPDSTLTTRMRPWTTPPQRGSKELIAGYRTDPWLRACARASGQACAGVRLRLYKGKGKARVEIEDHPLLDLLDRPNPVLSARAQRRITQTHYDLVGDAVWVKERNNRGEVVQLVPVPPHWLRTFPGRTSATFEISWRGVQASIRPEDVVWFHDPDPGDPFARGAGLAESLADELDTDEYASKFVKEFFYNRGSPETIASFEGANPEALKAMKAQWEAEFRGNGKSHRTLFSSGKIKVERLDTTFRDMSLVDLRAATRDIVISVWGVPPEIMGVLASSNRATIEAADLIMAKNVVKPRLEDFCDAVNMHLTPEFGDDLSLWFDNPVPEDREFKLRTTQARPSAFTDNEVRVLGGFEKADGKDEYPEPFAGVTALEGDPEFVRSLPARRKVRAAADGGLTEGQIPNVLEQLRPERLTAELQPVMQRRMEAWAKDQLAGLGADDKFDLLNPLIPKWLEEWSTTKIKGLVDGTTRDTLRDTLTEGVRAGESIDDLLDRVEDVFTAADTTRAEAIARTEVVGASNWATHEAQRISGVVEEREWIATRDGRTRAEHAALDGTKAKINEAFTVDGHQALYPGGFGVAELDIQCRCTIVAVVSDPGDDEGRAHKRAVATVPPDSTDEQRAAVWNAYDRELVPWEGDLTRAARRGFAGQRRDIRKALRDAAK